MRTGSNILRLLYQLSVTATILGFASEISTYNVAQAVMQYWRRQYATHSRATLSSRTLLVA